MTMTGVPFAGWVVREPTMCGKCQTPMGPGELAQSYGRGVPMHQNCPMVKETCKECNIQHAGECP